MTTNANKSTDKDGKLKVTAAARAGYLKAHSDFHASLKAARAEMEKLETLGNPGLIGSAVRTKMNLEEDVSGLAGVQKLMDKYLDFSEDWGDKAKKAMDTLVNDG